MQGLKRLTLHEPKVESSKVCFLHNFSWEAQNMPSSLVNLFLFKPPDTREYNIPSEIFYLETSKGYRIAATHIQRKGANVTILFSHGNAEDLNSAFHWMKKLSKKLDVNVVGYDYTGYGGSEGEFTTTSIKHFGAAANFRRFRANPFVFLADNFLKGLPSQKKCYADIEAVYNFLLETKGLNPEQIVLYGRSLGSGPSCYLASKTASNGRSVAGLILHSPFTSVYRVVFDAGVTLLGDKFPNIDRLKNVECPVCIVHGKKDKVIPFSHATALYEALPKKCQAEPFFVENMAHNYLGYEVEIALMGELNHYLDYHILARRLWMKQPKKKRRNTGVKAIYAEIRLC
jgi:pimeloyl-ACP methyl ester carboxylesterase